MIIIMSSVKKKRVENKKESRSPFFLMIIARKRVANTLIASLSLWIMITQRVNLFDIDRFMRKWQCKHFFGGKKTNFVK